MSLKSFLKTTFVAAALLLPGVHTFADPETVEELKGRYIEPSEDVQYGRFAAIKFDAILQPLNALINALKAKEGEAFITYLKDPAKGLAQLVRVLKNIQFITNDESARGFRGIGTKLGIDLGDGKEQMDGYVSDLSTRFNDISDDEDKIVVFKAFLNEMRDKLKEMRKPFAALSLEASWQPEGEAFDEASDKIKEVMKIGALGEGMKPFLEHVSTWSSDVKDSSDEFALADFLSLYTGDAMSYMLGDLNDVMWSFLSVSSEHDEGSKNLVNGAQVYAWTLGMPTLKMAKDFYKCVTGGKEYAADYQNQDFKARKYPFSPYDMQTVFFKLSDEKEIHNFFAWWQGRGPDERAEFLNTTLKNLREIVTNINTFATPEEAKKATEIIEAQIVNQTKITGFLGSGALNAVQREQAIESLRLIEQTIKGQKSVIEGFQMLQKYKKAFARGEEKSIFPPHFLVYLFKNYDNLDEMQIVWAEAVGAFVGDPVGYAQKFYVEDQHYLSFDPDRLKTSEDMMNVFRYDVPLALQEIADVCQTYADGFSGVPVAEE